MATSWYGKQASKQIENVLDGKPKLYQLLEMPDLFNQLKDQNSRLSNYITNNPTLISEVISYLTISPLPTDSNNRKFKLPLQAIEIIETEANCIINGFFKEGERRQLNIDLLFRMLDQKQLLPLLAGYFLRANTCLLNKKYKETLDKVYSNSNIFLQLIVHSQHMGISGCLSNFLKIEAAKIKIPEEEKTKIKIQTVKTIISKIREKKQQKDSNSLPIIENLVSILIDIIDKYDLILDGKQMIEAITDQASIQIFMSLVQENSELSFPAFSFFISLINYYSFSSFNAEDNSPNSEAARKNVEKVQKEPMVQEMLGMFGWGLSRIMSAPRMDLYHFRMLEVLCHCISIASNSILRRICEVRFFGNLIDLLFRHEQCNILHMLIEKSFYHVFISQRKIYQDYKTHLFCQLDIIDLTASRILHLFPEQTFMKQISKKGYFGHFMRILKIYSGIQPKEPKDERIIQAIKSKTKIWNKVSQILIKPYEQISLKELGTYENIPNPLTQEFVLQRHANLNPLPQNNIAIQEIQKQEQYPLPHNEKKEHEKKGEDNITHNYLFDHEPATLKIVDHLPSIAEQPPKQPSLRQVASSDLSSSETMSSKDLKKTESYQEFMKKKKQQAGKDIKDRRSLSNEKKLSKGKIASPSPNKRDKWSEKNQKQPAISDKLRKQQPIIPKGPISRRIGPSTSAGSIERQNRLMQQERKSPAPSKTVSLQQLKKIKVIQIDQPKQKKFRRACQKDQALLEFLGLSM